MTTIHSPTDRTRLSPEDAYNKHGSTSSLRGAAARQQQRRNRSRSRRRKGVWKKLLWVKQSYPDNYTDEETFLANLQRNPRLQPYEFWSLVAESTVIMQQVCAVTIFVCCFSCILQERVSPLTVVSWGTAGTVFGWILWDSWIGKEQSRASRSESKDTESEMDDQKESLGLGLSASSVSLNSAMAANHSPKRPQHSRTGSGNSTGNSSSLKLTTIAEPADGPNQQSRTTSASSIPLNTAQHTTGHPTGASTFAAHSPLPPYGETKSAMGPIRLSTRNQQRLATAKSALLIFFALLGLSPILKSLTQSTASDSIWAISFWLMGINVVFFDYSGGVSATFPASLSTNAALMASTVLASRLPSTTHVFSLTLFSIEVFGLFPIFRRYLRHVSWRGHLSLTWFLVSAAGCGVAVSRQGATGWKSAIAGIILSNVLTGLAMGFCTWWLIGLQRYKNEIHGPWDPARPIVRARPWD